MPRPQSTSRQAEPKFTQVMHLCVYLSLCVFASPSLSLLVRVNALKMLHKLLPKHKYVSKYVCLALSLSLSLSLSPSLSVCAAAAVYCEVQLQNAHAAISRFVSSPSAKINMFVPGKTPLCHFSTFTLALQVRQAMPRLPPPPSLSPRLLVGVWQWQCQCDSSSKSKCITRKCIAYTQAQSGPDCGRVC